MKPKWRNRLSLLAGGIGLVLVGVLCAGCLPLVRLFQTPPIVALRCMDRDGSRRHFAVGTADGTVVLFDFKKGDNAAWQAVDCEPNTALTIAERANLCIAGYDSGACIAVRMFEAPPDRNGVLPSSRKVATLAGHTDRITAVDFSSDGEWAVTASRDQTARLWQVKTWEMKQIFQGHGAGVVAAAFQPNSHVVALGLEDGSVWRWDTVKGSTRRLGEHRKAVTVVKFDAPGQFLASGSSDGEVMLWSAVLGTCVVRMQGHLGPIRVITFNNAGTMLLTGAGDGTARLWDFGQACAVGVFVASCDTVTAADFNPWNSTVALGGSDGSIQLWDIWTLRNTKTWSPYRLPVTGLAWVEHNLLISVGQEGWMVCSPTDNLEKETRREFRENTGAAVMKDQLKNYAWALVVVLLGL